MSGPIKRVKYKPPMERNKKSNMDDSFDPGQEYWGNGNDDDSDTSPPPKRSMKQENVNLLKQANTLGMGNSCFGFTHALAEKELRLEKENISSDDQENSDSEAKESEKNDSIVDSGEEETTENTKDSMGLESENNMTSTEKVGTERDDHPKNADSQPKKSPESSSSEDDEMTEEVAKMRLLLEAKMKAELEMKLDKFKSKKKKAKKASRFSNSEFNPEVEENQASKKAPTKKQKQSPTGLTSGEDDEKLELKLKRKARNKKLKKIQSKEPVSEISSSSSDKDELDVDVTRKRKSKQKKFDDRNREDLYGDENFDVEEGISPLMKFRNQNSERSASCDDQSGRPREKGKNLKDDDRPLKKCNIGDYFELYGVPDPKPECPMPKCKGQKYHDRSSLKRHLQSLHKYDLSKGKLEEILQTVPTVKEKSRCLICSWVGTITNRPAHFDLHIKKQEEEKLRALERRVPKQLQTNQITSFKEGPIPSKTDSLVTQIENFLSWMNIFMSHNQIKQQTFENYKPHFRKFLKIWNENQGLKSIYALWDLNDPDLIPVCDSYVDQIGSEPSKEQAVNAYKKMCDFIEREMGKQSTSEIQLRDNKMYKLSTLQSHRNLAHAKFKGLRGSSKANPEFISERKNRLAVIIENEIIPKYRSSDQRKYYALNKDNWLSLCKNNDFAYSFAKVRDFIILEILLCGGGNRMDAIRNMTVEDFLEKNPDGDGFFVTVKHHKTEKKDAVYIYLTPDLNNLITAFYQGVRKEKGFKNTFYGQYLFCTIDGSQLRRLDDSTNILNKFIKDNDLGDVQITPNDTRFLFSNWGENNTCEEIKRNVAAVQNHSQLTHDNHYNYAKAAQKKKLTLAFMEQMAGGESGDLNLATNSEYNNELSKEAEELKKKREIEKKEKRKNELKVQDRYNRHNLKPNERHLMIKLLYQPDSDGKASRLTVPVSDILKMRDENEKFRKMFDRVKVLLGKTDSQLAATMKASYRQYWRKKDAKNQDLILSDYDGEDDSEDDVEEDVTTKVTTKVTTDE